MTIKYVERVDDHDEAVGLEIERTLLACSNCVHAVPKGLDLDLGLGNGR